MHDEGVRHQLEQFAADRGDGGRSPRAAGRSRHRDPPCPGRTPGRGRRRGPPRARGHRGDHCRRHGRPNTTSVAEHGLGVRLASRFKLRRMEWVDGNLKAKSAAFRDSRSCSGSARASCCRSRCCRRRASCCDWASPTCSAASRRPVIGPFFQAMSAAGGALFDNLAAAVRRRCGDRFREEGRRLHRAGRRRRLPGDGQGGLQDHVAVRARRASSTRPASRRRSTTACSPASSSAC